MSAPLFAFVCCLVVGVALGAGTEESFNYREQSLWGGICNTRQSTSTVRLAIAILLVII